MPNWCYTSYKISGSRKAVKDLYERIMKLDRGEGEMLENGFENLWLGNLVNDLGGDWNKIYCRGQIISDITYDEDLNLLMFETETAWGVMTETFDFVKSYYECQNEELCVSYRGEECGCCLYCIHNEGEFEFVEEYCIDYFHDNDGGVDYCYDFSEVIEYFEEVYGVSVPRELNVEDSIKFMENYADEQSEDDFFYIYPYDYI